MGLAEVGMVGIVVALVAGLVAGFVAGRSLEQAPISTATTATEMALHMPTAVSYTHLRAHETVLDLVCRLLLEKQKKLITVPVHPNMKQ